ncbi:MAG TPA: rRNA maturation RNase YbeY [Opitutaceae bacterium]|nr:rRNA maturation RNase YbeY [Opitutaceae bacterium]
MIAPVPPSGSACSRAVAVHNGHPRLRLDARTVAALIHALDDRRKKFRGGCPPGELSVAFLTDAALARLHAAFLDDGTVTDVITFAGDPAHGLAGEICVSADAAARQIRTVRAGRSDKQENYRNELALYLVHGWLHLAGYDDLSPPKKRIMRAAERRALKLTAAAVARISCRLAE